MIGHIALLTDGIYPYVIGGMQKHSYYLAKYLASSGIKVDLYHTNQSDLAISKLEFFTEEEKKNIQSVVIPFPSGDRFPGHYIRDSYKYSMAVFNEFIKRKQPDFVYIKGFAGWKLLEEKKKGIPLPPTGVKFHGFEMFQPSDSLSSYLQSRLLLRSPVLKCLSMADAIFSYGGKITSIVKSLKVTDDKIIEIPTGIERQLLVNEPSPDHHPRSFVFIGRYEKRKGIDALNKALMQLLNTDDFIFHFIGPIPDDKKINNSRIVYHGKIMDQHRVGELLRDADVLVTPSHSEGMPNVIVEAMARGLAVIATDVGAVNVMVNETNGWLIPPFDTTALKEALLNAIKCNVQELTMKKQASLKKVKEQFLWEEIIPLTLSKINSFLDCK